MFNKSTLFIVVAMVMAIPSRAQFLDFKQNSERLFLGVQLGQAGTATEFHGFGWGLSLSVCGVYVDFLRSSPQYVSDNHLINELWDDYSAYTISLGYQIPVFPWLRLVPIIGYSQTNYGFTDIGTLNQHVDEDGNITNRHDYVVEKRFHELNYGGGVFIQPLDHLEFYGVCTRRAIYGGISIGGNATTMRNWNP